MGIGDWGLGIGDWGLGIGPKPQSPIPNPPIPIYLIIISFNLTKNNYFFQLKELYKKKIFKKWKIVILILELIKAVLSNF
jgi:hypothetical protein